MRKGLRRCGFVLLGLASLVAIQSLRRPEAEEPVPDSPRMAQRNEAEARRGARQSSKVETTAAAMIEADWENLLVWLGADPKPEEDEICARLIALRSDWSEMDPHVLAKTIEGLLASKADVALGLKFRVGPQGLLEGWPSARVFLLDALAAADPETAAGIAKTLLDTTTSPDEYAVALRALVRQLPDAVDHAELVVRFEHMLGNRGWQDSGGFMEALDLARFVGTATAATPLLRWEGNPALKSMALHEFAADHPGAMLDSLPSNPDLEPTLRANLMARLDPAEPTQSAALDRYLRAPGLEVAEASVFLKSFPLRSATTGHRLYGRQPAPYQMERIAQGDRAALVLVDGWMADPALDAVRPELRDLRKRLGDWVAQAE